MSWSNRLRGVCQGFAQGGEYRGLQRAQRPPAQPRKPQAPAGTQSPK